MNYNDYGMTQQHPSIARKRAEQEREVKRAANRMPAQQVEIQRGQFQTYNPANAGAYGKINEAAMQAQRDKQSAASKQLEEMKARAANTTGKTVHQIGAEQAAISRLSQEIEKSNSELGRLQSRAGEIGAAQQAEGVAKGYESRQIDQGAYNLMRQAAEGNAPSRAELMLANESRNLGILARRQSAQAYNQSLSAANSARTYNPALARSAMFANASQQADIGGRALEGQQSLSGQAAALRADEMAQARGAFGQYGLAQQGINDAAANARRAQNMGYDQLNQQGRLAESQAQFQNAQMANQMTLGYDQMFNAREMQNSQNQWGFVSGGIGGKILSDVDAKSNLQLMSGPGMQAPQSNQKKDNTGETISTIASIAALFSDARSKQTVTPMQTAQNVNGALNSNDGFGTIASLGKLFSDERAKEKVSQSGSISDQLAQVQPVAYEYKKGYGKPGERVGVIAQDLAKTPVGNAMVGEKSHKGKTMKAIDGQAAVSTLLANAAEQGKRIQELEAKQQGPIIPAPPGVDIDTSSRAIYAEEPRAIYVDEPKLRMVSQNDIDAQPVRADDLFTQLRGANILTQKPSHAAVSRPRGEPIRVERSEAANKSPTIFGELVKDYERQNGIVPGPKEMSRLGQIARRLGGG